MSWYVPVFLVLLNGVFALLGYFLGKKTQANSDVKHWVERYNEVRAIEDRTRELAEQHIRDLEREKALFEKASWQQKLEYLKKGPLDK